MQYPWVLHFDKKLYFAASKHVRYAHPAS